MKKVIKYYQLFFYILISPLSFSQNSTGLKDIFANDFLIGTALGAEHILEKNKIANNLILREFNAITPENIMKAEVIHPEPNNYSFTLADKFVEYGQKNNLFIAGHTLVWHSQLPKFVHKIQSADSVRLFMTNHINTVAGRYKGKINSWDVVNEALNEDGTLRKSIFLEKLGEGYIKEAFDLAAKADPNAELYYNDYNIEQPAKRKGAIELIKKLQASGTKINGVGIQGHWSLKGAPLKDIEESIIEFSKLGLKVAFTELDITVLPNPWDLKGADVNQNFPGSPFMNPYPKGLPDSVQTELAQRYSDIFKIFIKHRDKISRITFWGVNDGHSWLNGWPIRNRTNYPLLFDREFQKKPAYEAVIKQKSKQ
ncbi:glycoside hydrolase family 10 [Emticicia oligotrophica DSM 17448]|uniref:Beta-xylanase n=1 Tax=Emticicia oligotrophica (strain DSM 17448 / CIP 109782 / MTCC 6937 / GPTSA100-15) TaxID=929562 RepID=A0ABN4AQ01_EMTOG|nr:endo-1,4-beta-xylanase [Emticicia oligotrophica]AFK04483.1 glycoside hydrolase family 10 [Emticicia oligotrophica DSM 17448]